MSFRRPDWGRVKDIMVSYATLGFVSFGGPPAHMALLHNLFVEKKKWIDDAIYTELLGICQALPGPASTQLAFSIAVCYGGIVGGIVAFLLWSLPMMIVMTGAAIGVSHLSVPFPGYIREVVNGLVSVAVGLVALAAFKLGQKAVTDKLTLLLCLLAACATTAHTAPWLDPCLMIFGGVMTFGFDNRQWLLGLVKQRLFGEHDRSGFRMRRIMSESGAALNEEDRAAAVPLPPQPPPPLQEPTSSSYQPPQASSLSDPSASTTKPDAAEENKSPGISARSDSVRISVAAAPTSPTTTTNPDSPPLPAVDPKARAVEDLSAGLDYSPVFGVFVLVLSIAILIVLVVIKSLLNDPPKEFALITNLYIAGTIIFGGGPVVIPLLHSYVVDPGWVSEREFLVGLAFVNVLPGPNFNFGPYCGALTLRSPTIYAILGAVLGYFGIFFPGLALKLGLLPLWKHLRGRPSIKSILRGVSASAVGLVFYAVYVLWRRAISLPDEKGSMAPLDDYPLYVIVTAISFVTVGPLGLPAPAVVIWGGVVGLLKWVAVDR